MSTPTTAEALHDLRAAQALIDRALKALNAATPVMREGAPQQSEKAKRRAPRYFGDESAPKEE